MSGGVDIDAVHLRRAKQAQKAEKQPGGAVAAVRAYLASNCGTPAAISEATGYSRSSVEVGLAKLRLTHDPVLANLQNWHTERGRRIQAEKFAAEVQREQVGSETTVARALAARTPLEEAWR